MDRRDELLWDLIQELDQEEGEPSWQQALQQQEEAFLATLTVEQRRLYYLYRSQWMRLQHMAEINRFRQGICWGIRLTGQNKEGEGSLFLP